jgi:hypothetical protein
LGVASKEFLMRKLIFLDAFVLIRGAEDNAFADLTRKYIEAEQYTLLVGLMNLIEIYKWKKHWPQICDFIASIPFCIAPDPRRIADAEISSYPNRSDLPTVFCSSEHAFSRTELKEAIEINLEQVISSFERDYRATYRDIWASILSNRATFLPEENGKYSSTQRWLFLQHNVFKWLYPEHSEFLHSLTARSQEIKTECFRSVYIQMLAIFLEYYVHKKDGKASDIGDFYQLSVLPHVELAVVDNERRDLIEKINRQQLFPDKIPAHNYSEFRQIIQEWLMTGT